MYYDRYVRTINRLMEMGYSAVNLVIGVGGILRNWTRDTLGFAIKATYVEVDGEPRDIEKDPITDHKKRSHKGLLSLWWDDEHKTAVTKDQCTWDEEKQSILRTVFKNGKILKEYTLDEIRDKVRLS